MKKIWRIVSSVLAFLIIGAALLLISLRLMGLTPYTILSGSMEPTYPVGSLIYVKQVSPLQVKAGDPITFVFNDDLVVATHRVVMVDQANSHFYTKGDANANEDAAPVHFNNLLGVPQFHIPYAGYLASFIMTDIGRYVSIGVIALLLILSFVPDLVARRKARKAAGEAQIQPAETTDSKAAHS